MTNITPSNDNKPSPVNAATVIAALRIIVGMLAATTVGAKFLTPDLVAWINAQIPTVVPAVIAVAVFAYGVWTKTRPAQIKATAALPGATVVLDSQAEANAHPTPNVVGPNDPLPVKTAA